MNELIHVLRMFFRFYHTFDIIYFLHVFFQTFHRDNDPFKQIEKRMFIF